MSIVTIGKNRAAYTGRSRKPMTIYPDNSDFVRQFRILKDNDIDQAKGLLARAKFTGEQKNKLLIRHLIDDNNLAISELLLKNGADANCVTGNEDGVSSGRLGNVQRCAADWFGTGVYQDEHFAVTLCYAEGFFSSDDDDRKMALLPKKVSLLIENGLDVNVTNKFREPLIYILADRLRPYSHTSDEFRKSYNTAIAQTIALLLDNKAILSEKTYNKNKYIFKDALYHLGGMQSIQKLKRTDASYQEYYAIMEGSLNCNKNSSKERN